MNQQTLVTFAALCSAMFANTPRIPLEQARVVALDTGVCAVDLLRGGRPGEHKSGEGGGRPSMRDSHGPVTGTESGHDGYADVYYTFDFHRLACFWICTTD